MCIYIYIHTVCVYKYIHISMYIYNIYTYIIHNCPPVQFTWAAILLHCEVAPLPLRGPEKRPLNPEPRLVLKWVQWLGWFGGTQILETLHMIKVFRRMATLLRSVLLSKRRAWTLQYLLGPRKNHTFSRRFLRWVWCATATGTRWRLSGFAKRLRVTSVVENGFKNLTAGKSSVVCTSNIIIVLPGKARITRRFPWYFWPCFRIPHGGWPRPCWVDEDRLSSPRGRGCTQLEIDHGRHGKFEMTRVNSRYTKAIKAIVNQGHVAKICQDTTVLLQHFHWLQPFIKAHMDRLHIAALCCTADKSVFELSVASPFKGDIWISPF